MDDLIFQLLCSLDSSTCGLHLLNDRPVDIRDIGENASLASFFNVDSGLYDRQFFGCFHHSLDHLFHRLYHICCIFNHFSLFNFFLN